MKNAFPVYFAVLLALGASWFGFVLAPAMQLGAVQQTAVLNSSETYPPLRTGDATLGLQVYRANGCAACHTQQVRQDDVRCDIVVTDMGKNQAAVAKILASHPLTHIKKELADATATEISNAGGKVEIHIVPVGGDIERGWGSRRSVAEDFLHDDPVQLGTLRAGPDLADVGARLPSAPWHLMHLYAPKSVVNTSRMPSYAYLFNVQKIGAAPSPDALALPPGTVPAGYEVVPKPEALQLADYLLSLRADVPIYDAPFTPPSKP